MNVQPEYVLAAAGIVAELAGSLFRISAIRKLLYGVSAVSIIAVIIMLVPHYGGIGVVAAILVAVYRFINSLRVLAGRMHEDRLVVVSRRTSWTLILCQLAGIGLAALDYRINLSLRGWGFVLLAAALAGGVIMLLATRRNLTKARVRASDKYQPDTHLPTVSVCIPARNETQSLAACIDAVLASDYPKLEVLVLDDCSHHATSEIIKGFARDGVRFIKGVPPKRGWLAKNQAYAELTEAASGEILFFIGVDVRLDQATIRRLVGSLVARKKSMISVLPRGIQKYADSSIIQPMRYWWELALPRRTFGRPPVLSTAWMIKREVLSRAGGFAAVRNSVLPEGYFAREAAKNDGYSFMRSTSKLEVITAKSLEDQLETVIRMRYPQLRHRPEAVLLVTLTELVLFVLPLSVFVAGFITPLGMLWVLAGIVSLLLFTTHYLIVRAWQIPGALQATAMLPVAVLAELSLMQLSMIKYEFGKVIWKDRNICIPVIKAVPRLPQV